METLYIPSYTIGDYLHFGTNHPYDLYSKSAERPDVVSLRPYYENLIAEYFPSKIRW